MFSWFTNIFSSTPSIASKELPGRTFKRILTNDYFGLAKNITDIQRQENARNRKIAQIKEYHLTPAYIRYYYENNEIVSAKIAFQKEELAEKWNMLHVTEISFLLYAEEFTIFETMAQVKLKKDFQNVTPQHEVYLGVERRKKQRI